MLFSVKPSLKRVSKNENKYANLQKKAAEFNFRNRLKTVKKKEFTIEDDNEAQENKKPDWRRESQKSSKSFSEPSQDAAEVPTDQRETIPDF